MKSKRHDDISGEMMLSESGAVRWFLLIAGTISLGLGIIGLLLPVVPTTPFLLVSAACYVRSSRKFYTLLMTNRFFGQYIRDWRAGKGIPLLGKVGSTLVIVATFGASIVFFVPFDWLKVLMIAIAIMVLIYLWQLPTRRD